MEENTLTGDFENLRAVLQEYGEAVVTAYRKEMDERGKNASHKLERGLHVQVVTTGGGLFAPAFAVDLSLPAYWFNVEYGRPPCPPSKHWIPVEALIKWIKIKPVIPYPDKNGRIPTTRQLAFLINRAINDPDRTGEDPKRPGIAPTPVMQSAVEAVDARFLPLIEAALYKDVEKFANGITFSDFSTQAAGRSNVVRGRHKGR